MNRSRRPPQALIVDDDEHRALRLRSLGPLAALDAVAVKWSPEVIPLADLLQPSVIVAAVSDRYAFAFQQMCERAIDATIIAMGAHESVGVSSRVRTAESEEDIASMFEDRRSSAARVASAPLQLGNTTVDIERGYVLRDNRSVALAPCEHAVLTALARRAGECVSRETLLDEVWKGKATSSRVVDRQIFLLRRRIEENPRRPRFIVTAFERGYRLVLAEP